MLWSSRRAMAQLSDQEVREVRGKEKCKALKEIRVQIARENDIPYAVSQCTYQGECRGTCPKCEAELRDLERQLAIRQGLGKAVAVAGISVSVCGALTACSPADMVRDFWGTEAVETAGDIAMPESRTEPGGMATLPEGQDDDGDPGQNLDYGQEGAGEGSEGRTDSLPGEVPEPEYVDEVLAGELPLSEEETMEIEGRIALPEGEAMEGESLPLPEGEAMEGESLPLPEGENAEGEGLTGPEVQQEQMPEIEGDIALPEEGTEPGGENAPVFKEAAP